jgi:hypothetical protein
MIRPHHVAPEVRAAAARFRRFVHPGQIDPGTSCPICGERSAPTWPLGHERRVAEAFVSMCAGHRERAQVEQVCRGASESEAVAAAWTGRPLRSSAPVEAAELEVADDEPVEGNHRAHHDHNTCGLCHRVGHNRRGCPTRAGREARQ